MTDEVKKTLPLNIQMFADDQKGDDESETEEVVKNDDNDKKSGENDKKSQESEKKYTDDDVNSISMKNERKAVRDALKKLGYKVPVNATKEELDAIINEASNKDMKGESGEKKKPGVEEFSKEVEKNTRYVNAELKIALLQADVKREKIDRAINLIDKSKILDDGEIDNDKLAEEIESLTKDWPELLDSKKEDNSSIGFVVGSDGKEEKSTDGAKLSEIFGNK